MRLLKKRRCLCFVALVTLLVIFSLMLTQMVILDFTGTIRFAVPTGIRNYVTGSGILYIGEGSSSPQSRCTPVHNVAFVKTHKAGSSTIANILQRFGISHMLTFALPNTVHHTYAYNYISKPGEILTKEKIVPLQKGQVYNILFHHAIYNRTAFREIMPEGTSYITILREPFQQFVSAFEYYHIDKLLAAINSDIRNVSNPVSEYLANPDKYSKGKTPGPFSYVRNKQAEDLGFGGNEFTVAEHLHNYISQMDKDFVLVMIMERFDESLLLLKKLLCWDMKDILYIPLNKNKRKPSRNFTKDDYIRHRRFSHLDYALYNHFLEVFEKHIASQDQDFDQELGNYQALLNQVKNRCMRKASFQVPETKWYDAFNFTLTDCALMTMSELTGLDQLYIRAGRTRDGPRVVRRFPTLINAPRTGQKNALTPHKIQQGAPRPTVHNPDTS